MQISYTRLQRIVAFLLSIVMLGYLVVRSYQGANQLWETGLKIDPLFALGALSCQVLGVLLAVLIWSQIINQLGYRYPFWFHFQVFGISALVRKLPGTVWYAITRLKIYEQKGVSRKTMLIALSLEVLTLSCAGLGGFLIGLANGFPQTVILNQLKYTTLEVLIIAVVCLCLFAGIQRFTGWTWLDKARRTLSLPEEVNIANFLLWLTGELLVIILATGVLFFVCLALYPNAILSFTSLLGAFALAVALGPIAMWIPGDIGLKDGFVYIILRLAIGDAPAALATLVWRLSVTLLETLVGLFCSFSLGFKYFSTRSS